MISACLLLGGPKGPPIFMKEYRGAAVRSAGVAQERSGWKTQNKPGRRKPSGHRSDHREWGAHTGRMSFSASAAGEAMCSLRAPRRYWEGVTPMVRLKALEKVSGSG